jgi:hypothetical protein
MLGPEIENLIYIIIPGTVFVFLISAYLIFQKGPGKTKAKADDIDHAQPIAADYNLIVERLLKLPSTNKSIIFIAPGIESLPTTVPVNVAIQLAKNKRRCFLIDLDLKRNAIAKAFDIHPEPGADISQPTAQQTPFKQLYIWPAHNFTQIQKINIAPLVTAAIRKFDYVLVNAPYLITNQTWKQIIDTSQYCVLFSHDTEQAQPILELIEQTECKIIANIQLA